MPFLSIDLCVDFEDFDVGGFEVGFELFKVHLAVSRSEMII
jgi:hypothetical protein